MVCKDHNNRDLWIGKADGIFCQICGARINTKASAPAPEPEKKAPTKKPEPAPEPEKKAPAKKAPAKKTTTRGGKK